MFQDLTVVIPVKDPPNLELFIDSMKWLLSNSKVITCDSGGGEALQEYSWKYIQKQVSMWTARRIGYDLVQTDYILNLDVDTVLPINYVKESLKILREDKADAVAIDYEKLQGHYAFGTSLWKTTILKKLYDFSSNIISDGKTIKVGFQMYSNLNNGWCECTYMFHKLKQNGYRLETLPYRAKHLK